MVSSRGTRRSENRINVEAKHGDSRIGFLNGRRCRDSMLRITAQKTCPQLPHQNPTIGRVIKPGSAIRAGSCDKSRAETQERGANKRRKHPANEAVSALKSVVGDTGLEPVTPAMSRRLTSSNERKTRRFGATKAENDAQTHVRSHVKRKPGSSHIPSSP